MALLLWHIMKCNNMCYHPAVRGVLKADAGYHISNLMQALKYPGTDLSTLLVGWVNL